MMCFSEFILTFLSADESVKKCIKTLLKDVPEKELGKWERVDLEFMKLGLITYAESMKTEELIKKICRD